MTIEKFLFFLEEFIIKVGEINGEIIWIKKFM